MAGPGLSEAGALNVLAGTDGLSEAGAANAYAATSRLSVAGALNAKALTDGLSGAGAANVLAGTTDLSLAGALNAIVDRVHVVMPGAVGDYISTPDAAVLDITGDIDLRAKVRLNDWTPAAQTWVISKADAGGVDRAYGLIVQVDGALNLTWSTDGSALLAEGSGTVTPFTDGQTGWIRATLDVNNGASDAEVKFYTSTDGETWTQLGTTQLVGATTTIFAGGDNLQIGARSEGASNFVIGRFYEAEIRNGIDGTVATHPVAAPSGVVDDRGLVYTLHGNTSIAYNA